MLQQTLPVRSAQHGGPRSSNGMPYRLPRRQWPGEGRLRIPSVRDAFTEGTQSTASGAWNQSRSMLG